MKKYTTISNKFIDTYYNFYDLCKINKFGTNVDLLIKYLEYSDINKFYERLRKNYIKIKASKQENTNKKINYFITFDCFSKYA